MVVRGTIEPRKNIDGLLSSYEYYRQISDNPRPLVIVGGKGWMSEAYHQRLEELEQKNDLIYYGYVPDSKLIDLYEKAFALLFPSHYEGFGLPVIEAMNFSLPVISNDIKSIQEFASNAATFVDFNNPSEVASRMIKLESDQDAYNEQSRQSKKTALKHDRSQTAEKVFSLYEAAIEYNNSI